MKGVLIKKSLIGTIVYLVLLYGLAFTGNCQTDSRGLEYDSIYDIFQKTEYTNEKLESLKNLAQLVRQTPLEVTYLHQLLGLANQVDSANYSDWALSSLGRYYANENRPDSLLCWVEYVDSITKDLKEKPEVVFAIHNYLCRYYIINGKLELAMNEAVKQKSLADRMDNQMGMIYSLENLGLIYFSAGRTDLMLLPLEQALDLLGKSGIYPEYEEQIMEVLIVGYLKEKKLDKAEDLLKHIGIILDKIQNSTDLRFNAFPLNETWCIMYSYLTQLYIAKQDKQKAATVSHMAKSYWNEFNHTDTKDTYFISQAYYSYFTKNYNEVFVNLEQVRDSSDLVEILELKIKTYRSMNDIKMALATYGQLVDISKNININAYNKQVDQLNSLQNLNAKEKENLELENQKRVIRQKQLQLLYLVISSSALLVLLGILLRYIHQTRKLKNILGKEKQSLKEINLNLSLAKAKADKASQIKSDFISNMSHEIITPLNAIVCFSTLLDTTSEDEEKVCIQMINQNTEILLKHVDEVLKLSPFQNYDSTSIMKD